MWHPKPEDFEAVRAWGLDQNPFAAVDDYSELKKELRWLNQDHRDLWEAYIYTRMGHIGKENYEEYYRTAEKPLEKLRWEYLKLRKAWYIMPLGWHHAAEQSCKVIDMGCGDGDTVQRLIDLIDRIWKKGNITERTVHIVGTDLNHSRIKNANSLVTSPNKNITFEFHQADTVGGELRRYKSGEFDFCLSTGVLEILEDGPCGKFMDEMCRITKKGIYIEDLYDRFPGGYPRQLESWFEQRGFKIKEKKIVLSEPFDIAKSRDPMKIWPVMVDQNLWVERM